MRKKFNLLIALLLVVVSAVMVLASCNKPEEPAPVDDGVIKDYGVTPLADLTDYTDTASRAPVVYSAEKTDVQNKLNAKILTEKSYYDAYRAYLISGNNNAVYLVFSADGTSVSTAMSGRFEAGKITEQSSLMKILANSSAEQLINVLGYSGLGEAKMKALVDYLATDGNDAKGVSNPANAAKATGLIEDYLAVRDWSDEIDTNGTSTSQGQDIYKKRARKSRAMNKKIVETGMDGGDFGRVCLEMFQYIQIVAEEMRETDNLASLGAYDDMSTYFKKELLDYDTLVLIRANNDVRWTTAQGLTAVSKEVVLAGTSYAGSYSKPLAADGALVCAYGYSYDYEKANDAALSDADFEKNLEYRFMDSMTDDAAKDFRRIQREQYAKSYRYSASFYKDKFYKSLDPINEKQEIYEAKVYGFNNDDRTNDAASLSNKDTFGASTLTVSGAGGSYTEATISLVIGGKIGDYAKETKEGVNVGIADQLAMGDMEYYYWGLDANTLAQAAAQRLYVGNTFAETSEGEFRLKLINLKMADFVMTQFMGTSNSAGLANVVKAQTRGYRGDYIRMIKAYRRQAVRQIASMVKNGVLTENYDPSSKALSYTVVGSYTVADQEAVRDNIGKASAMINSLSGNLGLVNDVTYYDRTNSTQWNLIATQIRDTVNYDYDSISTGWGNKTKQLEDQLIHKNPDQSYDTNWETSKFFSNHELVLMYGMGNVRINFQAPTSVATDEKLIFGAHEVVYGTSGETLGDMVAEKKYNAVSTSSGTTITYAHDATVYYLWYDAASKSYFYPVLPTDVVDYDLTLYAYYKVQP